MVFCNIDIDNVKIDTMDCHNPYFSRWFSAIDFRIVKINKYVESHNPYFSRWFSAI